MLRALTITCIHICTFFIIDNLPEPRSVYREHENLWKFYVDLERFKKGLEHEDYSYVVSILQDYVEKQDERWFVRACCNIFRTEVKRSDYHLTNIIQLTGKEMLESEDIITDDIE